MKKIPDAFIISLFLTLLVFVFSFAFGTLSFEDMFLVWGNGLFSLLGFTLQMGMVLIFGATLAKSKPVDSLLTKFIALPKTKVGAHLFVSIVSIISCFFNWGFGLIVSAILATKMAKVRKDTSFPLLVASAYAGFLVWHGGLSGSIPLSLTQVTAELKPYIGVDSIPFKETLFSNLNIALLISVSLSILICTYFLIPKNVSSLTIKEEQVPREENKKSLSYFYLISLILMLLYFIFYFRNGGGITLNIVILLFLFLSMALHKTPHNFLFHFNSSVKDASGIILQFPFYAGIMALMQESGLALKLSEFFVTYSTKETLPFYTYLSAGLLNIFIPSGGGQWAVQGPIMLKAANSLGTDPVKVSLAISWGDAWTNMIQPFWALPLLSLAKLELKDIFKELMVYFFVSGIVSGIIFLIFT